MDPIQPDKRPDATNQPTEPQAPTNTPRYDTVPSDATSASDSAGPAAWNMGPSPEAVSPTATPDTQPLSTGSVAPVAATGGQYDTPSQNEHMVVGGMSGLSSYDVASPEKTGKSRKKWWLGGGVLVLALLLATGWVFGFYLPNKPENVWKTGLNRTGDALDSLVNTGTDQKAIDQFKSITMSGDATVAAKGFNMKTSFNGQFDDSYVKGNMTVTAKASTGEEYKISSDAIAKILPNQDYPDVYLKLSGFKDLGLDAYLPGINNFDGKWIFASSANLHKYFGDIPDSTSNGQDITGKDISDLVQNVNKTAKEYIFNSDTSKTILVNKQFVGKEKQEGLDTYHYKASFDMKNVKAFCSALWNGVATTQVYKKTVDEKDRAKHKDSLIKSCQEVDPSSKNDTFDIWIDSHYKLIHKVRLHDDKDKSMYVDLGQTYKGGDEFSLFAVVHDPTEKIDMSWNQTSNMKTNESTGKVHIVSKDGDNGYTADGSYSIKLETQKVKQDIPSGAQPLPDVLKKLGFPEPSEPLVPASVRSF